jgi:hypothetical protein
MSSDHDDVELSDGLTRGRDTDSPNRPFDGRAG